MKSDLIDILGCPMCKKGLVLTTYVVDSKQEIIEGILYCKKCNIDYQIENGIPNLLPPGYVVKYSEAFVVK